MNFRPELAAAVMAGDKTVTRRMTSPNPNSPWWEGGCALRVGRDYAVCPGRGKHAIGHIEVTDVRREWFYPDRITVADALAEGFEHPQAFRDTWLELHGNLDGPVDVWRIRFIPAGTIAAAVDAVVNEYEDVKTDVEKIARQLHAQNQDEATWDKLEGGTRDDYYMFASRVLACPSVRAAFEAQAKLEAERAEVDRLREELFGLLVFARGNPVVLAKIHGALDGRVEEGGEL